MFISLNFIVLYCTGAPSPDSKLFQILHACAHTHVIPSTQLFLAIEYLLLKVQSYEFTSLVTLPTSQVLSNVAALDGVTLQCSQYSHINIH